MQLNSTLTNLRDETINLLNERPVSLTTKEIATFLGVSTHWVNKFSRGCISNPGVNTIETLNAFLKQEIKKVAKNVK